MTTALLEPFESFFNWSTATGWTIVAGRTGNCFQSSSGATPISEYRVPSTLESATITLGFAFQTSSLAAARQIISLASDATLTTHLTFVANADGSVGVRRGIATGTILGTTVAGLLAINTWAYVEIQAVLSDTVGTVSITINGTSRLALTAQDTKNGGTKTVFDTVRILGVTGTSSMFDDMYVAMGGGEAFRGSQTLSALSAAVDARQSARVAFQGAAAATDIIRNARHSVRVAIGPVAPGVFVKAWNGSAFVSAPVKVWNGSAFVDATAVKTWNGSAFV